MSDDDDITGKVFTAEQWQEMQRRAANDRRAADAADNLPPSLSEFSKLPFPPVKPIMGPFTDQQIVFVYASTGVGKTMYCLKLALSFAKGQRFCNWPAPEPMRVLYIDGEMPGAVMQDRLKGVSSDNLFIANIPTWAPSVGAEGLNLANPEHQDLVDRWMTRLDAKALFLDNVMSLVSRSGVSMNSDEFWRLISPWCIQQRARGRCIVLVDHANEQGRLFGTRTKEWPADLNIYLSSISDAEKDLDLAPFDLVQGRENRVMKFSYKKVRNLVVDQDEFLIRFSDLDKEWTVEKAVESQRRAASQLKSTGMNNKDIAKELGIGLSTVYRWLKQK